LNPGSGGEIPQTGTRQNALWGRRGDSRGNALWGRKNESRSNALWGRAGKRNALLLGVAALLVLPVGANAAGGQGSSTSFVSTDVLKKANENPNGKLRVIIQSTGGVAGAANAFLKANAGDPSGTLTRKFDFIGGVAAEINAKKIAQLEQIPGLTVTLDAPVKLSGSVAYSSNQVWPYESGNAHLWGTPGQAAANQPTIAIVDSGLQPGRIDFGTRAYPQVNLSSLTPNALGDDRGHGTFVAGIAAGEAPGYAGADPAARILPIRVMDQNGMAKTSDVIAACNWILQNKAAYNIRVANFSLHSSAKNHFYNDPLDQAVEKLWFNGIFVVAAAGNYGTGNGPSGVWYAPGNDPFVLTVGAADLGGTVGVGNDQAAPFSAYGYTEDGFSKPEIGAAGRYMIGPVPATSTLVAQKLANVTAPGYLELSGTSFAAPVVAGSAAQLLAEHPTWTPDQLKGALMLTAKPAPNAAPGSVGVGEVNVGKADTLKTPPNANAAIDRFLVSDPLQGTVFAAASWNATVQANASWATASWGDASWSTASWSAASWGDASWSAASWGDASWGDSTSATADSAQEDAAEGDASAPAYTVTPTDVQDVSNDPYLAPPSSP
jgi:serine protease AprX